MCTQTPRSGLPTPTLNDRVKCKTNYEYLYEKSHNNVIMTTLIDQIIAERDFFRRPQIATPAFALTFEK